MPDQSLTGAAALIGALEARGVQFLFGIPGVHTLLPFDLLYDHPSIRAVVTRHEAGSGFAADGYARATGKPGICLVVPGPGATNVATAMLVAKSDSVPLVVITTSVPKALAGRYAIHELDLLALGKPLTKAQIDVTTVADITPGFFAAYAIATREPAGPVQLSIPYDLFGQAAGSLDFTGDGTNEDAVVGGGPPDATALNRALALLREARSPVIYAGHGVVRAGAGPALRAIAETLGAPVITSNKARGVFPEDHPLSVGIPSMAGVTAIARQADVCLALGTHFNEYTTLTWQARLPSNLIRVDLDRDVLDQNYPAAVGIHGDAAVVLEWLLERLPQAQRASLGSVAATSLRDARDERLLGFLAADSGAEAPFHPRLVARLLREALPSDALFLSDGSSTESWLYEPGFTVTRPNSIFVPEVQQTMGYAVGAALGAGLGAPGRPVVAVVGDGSLLMTLGELATIAAERVPLTICVFNDGCYNALRVRQEAVYDRRYVGTMIGDTNFVGIAEGVGLPAIRPTSLAQLRDALARAAECDAPLLLDIPTSSAPLSERYTAVIEAST